MKAHDWVDIKGRSEGQTVPPRQSDIENHVAYGTSAITTPSSQMPSDSTGLAMSPPAVTDTEHSAWRRRMRNPWACSLYMFLATLLGLALLFVMAHSFMTKQLDVKGCEMSYMRPSYSKYNDFDTEYTRFASKYSLYLYREGGVDGDSRVGCR